ncbi:MAG: lactate racemase domain-containing protein [Candidatus Bathyarchaeia archaeon]
MMLPRMVEVQQRIEAPRIDDYVSAIKEELREKGVGEKVRPGSKIAITAGSRGIAHYPEILSTVVEEVRRAGGEPFLIPAMGSHGGATPEGQLRVLRSLGITPETVKAPIKASMEVDMIGRLDDGTPVYVDRMALRADGIIVVGRVKPHTDFKGRIESGLMKMMAIGLGKQKGAETIHGRGPEGYHRLIPEAARMIMERAPVILGLAIVENARHEIAIVKALEPQEIEAEEERLLVKAKELLARLPFREIDVLIVDEIGKNISGTGMDTNVIGRFWLPGEAEPRAPRIRRIVVLDLSEETHGNAIGIGLADFTTQRAFSKIDFHETFVNSLTAGSPETARIPIHLPSDREAIAMALRTCWLADTREAKVVRIRNTLELERFWISESLMENVRMDKELSERIEALSEPREMQFDVLGTLAR